MLRSLSAASTCNGAPAPSCRQPAGTIQGSGFRLYGLGSCQDCFTSIYIRDPALFAILRHWATHFAARATHMTGVRLYASLLAFASSWHLCAYIAM